MGPDFVQGWCAFNLGLALVLLLRLPWHQYFGALPSYRLWWLAPLGAFATLLPAGGSELEPMRELLMLSTVAIPSVPAPFLKDVDWLMLIWGGGAVMIALAFLLGRVRLARYWRQQPRETDARCPRLPIVRAEFGPALVGFWRPVLVLPIDFELRYDALQQSLVLAHESAHARAGDLKVRAVLLLLAIAQWWNPLGWLALSKLIEDQELACDARVIEAFPDDRATYARTLTAGVSDGKRRTPLVCSMHPTHPLLRRIEMLNRRAPSIALRRWSNLLMMLLVLGVSAVAWAADQRAPAIVENPNPREYRVAITMQIDERAAQQFGFGDRAGKLMQANILDHGERIGIEVVVHETALANQVLVKMHLTRAGKVLGEPALAFLLNQSGRIEIGDRKAAGFSGVRIDITVTHDQSTALPGPVMREEPASVPGQLGALRDAGGDDR